MPETVHVRCTFLSSVINMDSWRCISPVEIKEIREAAMHRKDLQSCCAAHLSELGPIAVHEPWCLSEIFTALPDVGNLAMD